jgi:hypothetical protein
LRCAVLRAPAPWMDRTSRGDSSFPPGSLRRAMVAACHACSCCSTHARHFALLGGRAMRVAKAYLSPLHFTSLGSTLFARHVLRRTQTYQTPVCFALGYIHSRHTCHRRNRRSWTLLAPCTCVCVCGPATCLRCNASCSVTVQWRRRAVLIERGWAGGALVCR